MTEVRPSAIARVVPGSGLELPNDPEFSPRPDSGDELIATIARRHRVSVRDLYLQALLHLPRIADQNGALEFAELTAELDRLAVATGSGPAAELDRLGPVRPPSSPRDLTVEILDDVLARPIEEGLHYLRSWRGQSVSFGSVDGDQVAALAWVSALDLEPVIESLPSGLSAADVAVVSRVYAFDWAPRNTITFLLSRVARRLAAAPWGKRMLVTYVNPNVGFTGSSYRAANWTLYGLEHGTRYGYLDLDYLTDRRLNERFGTAEPDQLRALLGDRVRFSHMPLLPLQLYAYPLDRQTRADLWGQPPRQLRRPRLLAPRREPAQAAVR